MLKRLDAFIILKLHSCQMSSVTCLLHLLLMFSLYSAQVYSAVDTISITEPLQDPNFIVSSGATFKLGFFSPQNTTNRYVGIMFNIPKSTVVWVANRGNPLVDSSGILAISENGNLVVLNGKREILWSSNVENSLTNSSAQLLDDGNLILRNSSNGNSVWESFQNPTDTFLQGMKIGGSGNSTIQLASWRSQSDPSNGSFIVGVNSQPIPEIFVWNEGTLYWRSGPWDGNVFTGVPAMRSDYRNRFGLETVYFTFDNKNTSSLMHYELSFSGVIEQKILNEEGGWNVLFSSGNSECDVYAKCGPNGLCNPKGSPICSCLKGFKPKDVEEWTKGNWTGGCIRKTLLQCDKNNSSGHQGEADGYLRFTNFKLPHLSDVIQIPEFCDDECLKNCSCSAYTYVVGIGCLHWGENLMDIQQFSVEGPDLYIRVAYAELDHGMSKQKKKVIISTTVSVGCIFLAVMSYVSWNWLIKHRDAKQEAELSLTEAGEVWNKEMMIGGMSEKSKLEELPLYSYDTLAKATNEFQLKNRLGEGGFGPVYKGKLLTGQEIAVKRLSNSSSQGIKEFMNEVMVISKLQHRNLVRLLGCCVERAEKMLVYEYMPNKSLDGYLFDSQKQNMLDWKRRCAVIEGIGRGLLYLHKDSRLRIIHRDLKASNILLDEELNPKISDFGLARIFGGKQDQANTIRVVGTYGYMAPEYAMGGKFSEKSDVYSFGVLLLEIAIGKRSTSFHDDKEDLSLLAYAWKLWNGSEAVNMVVTEKLDPWIEMEVKRCIQVGLLCVQDSENDRPDIFNVLVMLNSDIRDLPNPKLPFYTAALPLSHDHSHVQSRNSVNWVSMTDVQGR